MMSEWKEYKLGELSIKIGSGATPKGGGESYKESGISLIRSQNVLDLKFSFDGLAYIDDEQASDLNNVTVNKNDVLLNITGDSVARVCKVPQKTLPARVNQHVAIIRSDNRKLDPDFLLYYLYDKKEHLLSLSEIGATRRALTKGMLENLEIIIPDIIIQRAIASILSSLDYKIDLLHRQNQTLEKMAETLFRQWFVEEAKEDWEDGTFGNWINGTLGGDWGKEEQDANWTKAVCCIRGTDISDLNNGIPAKTPVRFIKESKFQSIYPKEGDLIIEISGGTENQSTGRICYINEQIKRLFDYPLVFSNFCRLIRVKKSEYSFFLYGYIRYLYNQDEFFNLENGSSGIKNLDYKALLFENEYKMPDEESVLQFHSRVYHLYQKINQNKSQIRTLTALRDTLLPKLMSGEVRVEMSEKVRP